MTMWLRRNDFALPIICLAALVVLLFLPSGARNLPVVEEWELIEGGNKGEGMFYTPSGHESRPLQTAVYYIAYQLDPIGMRGFPLMLAVFLFLKGITIYGIMRLWMPKYRVLALLTAVFYLVIPADQGLFLTRALNIHAASFFYFAALYCMLKALTAKRALLPLLLGLFLSLTVGLLIYEGGYPLVLFSPLLVLSGPYSPRKRRWLVILVWWGTLVFSTLVKGILVAGATAVYQQWVFQFPTLSSALYPVGLSLARHFYLGWLETLPLLLQNILFLAFAVAGGVLITLATRFALLERRPNPEAVSMTRDFRKIFIAGIVILMLGVAAHIFTIFRYQDWRMYYYASFGGAMCIAVVVLSVYRRYGVRLTLPLTCILVVLGCVHALHQHETFAADSDAAQQLLNDTRAALPTIPEGTDIVYLNTPAGGTLHLDLFYHEPFSYPAIALRVLYPDYQGLRAIYVCRVEQCDVGESSVRIRLDNGNVVELPREHVLLFAYDPARGYELQ